MVDRHVFETTNHLLDQQLFIQEAYSRASTIQGQLQLKGSCNSRAATTVRHHLFKGCISFPFALVPSSLRLHEVNGTVGREVWVRGYYRGTCV